MTDDREELSGFAYIPRSHSAPCCSHRYMVDKEAPFSTTDHMMDVYEGWKPQVGYMRPLEPQYLPVRFKRVRSATDVRGLYDPDWTEGGLRANPFDSPTATASDLSSGIAGSNIAPSEENPQERPAVNLNLAGFHRSDVVNSIMQSMITSIMEPEARAAIAEPVGAVDDRGGGAAGRDKAKAKAKEVTSQGGDRGAGGAGGDPGAGAPAYDDSYGATVYVAAGEVGIFRAYQVNAGADTTTGEALSLVMGLQLNRHVPVDRVHACFIYAHHISAALTIESSYDNRILESGFESLDWHHGELFRDRIRRFSPYLVVYPRVRL